MKLKVYNERMFALIELAKKKGRIKNDIEFFKKIGVNAAISKFSSGCSFTATQMKKAARLTGVKLKWLLGLTDKIT